MKGRAIRRFIRHHEYDTSSTEKDGFVLLTIIEGISIGIEGRRNTAVLPISAKDQYIKIRQGSMTLMEYYDRAKSKLVAMALAGASLVDTATVEEIAVANEHDAPTDADRREAHDYVVAVRLVLPNNYPKYIAKLISYRMYVYCKASTRLICQGLSVCDIAQMR